MVIVECVGSSEMGIFGCSEMCCRFGGCYRQKRIVGMERVNVCLCVVTVSAVCLSTEIVNFWATSDPPDFWTRSVDPSDFWIARTGVRPGNENCLCEGSWGDLGLVGWRLVVYWRIDSVRSSELETVH